MFLLDKAQHQQRIQQTSQHVCPELGAETLLTGVLDATLIGNLQFSALRVKAVLTDGSVNVPHAL